ncbi:MAG: PEP-CTERM sorting domain-containing protein [Cyanobacteria bacterium J06639_1]
MTVAMSPSRPAASSLLKACFLAVASVALAVQPATAGVITGTTGNTTILSKPTSVNYPAGANIFAFVEEQDLAFAPSVTLDLGNIPAGRQVDSYLFHFDPIGSGSVTDTITFSQPILGFIWKTNRLDASDSVFNAFRPVGSWRGLDNNDFENTDTTSLVVGSQSLTLDLQAGGAGIDNVRVLVATPEPATTGGLLALGSLALAGVAKRRGRVSSTENTTAE